MAYTGPALSTDPISSRPGAQSVTLPRHSRRKSGGISFGTIYHGYGEWRTYNESREVTRLKQSCSRFSGKRHCESKISERNDKNTNLSISLLVSLDQKSYMLHKETLVILILKLRNYLLSAQKYWSHSRVFTSRVSCTSRFLFFSFFFSYRSFMELF